MPPSPIFRHTMRLRDPQRVYSGGIVSADTTLSSRNEITLVDTSGGSVTVTLPAAKNCRGCQIIVYKQVAPSTVTVAAAAGDQITYAGATTVTLNSKDDKTVLIGDGINTWLKIV